MQCSHTHLYGHTYLAWGAGHMHKFTCSTHIHMQACIYTGTYTCQHSLKVSNREANLISVFMYSVSHCPCVFHTSCRHVPSPSLSGLQPLLSADSPEKNLGAKSVPLEFGMWSRNTIRAQRLTFSFIFTLHRDTSLCMLKMTISCFAGFSLQVLPFSPLAEGWPFWCFCFISPHMLLLSIVWASPCNSSHHISQAGVKCYSDDLWVSLHQGSRLTIFFLTRSTVAP